MRVKYFYIAMMALLIAGCESTLTDNNAKNEIIISYAVLNTTHVKITLYNAYNTLIATLVDEKKTAGYYTVKLVDVELPPGVYFYIITRGGTVELKQLLVVQ